MCCVFFLEKEGVVELLARGDRCLTCVVKTEKIPLLREESSFGMSSGPTSQTSLCTGLHCTAVGVSFCLVSCGTPWNSRFFQVLLHACPIVLTVTVLLLNPDRLLSPFFYNGGGQRVSDSPLPSLSNDRSVAAVVCLI